MPALLALDSGGYYPTAWSWGALVFLWFAAIALVYRPALAPREAVLLGALVCLLVWTIVGATRSVATDAVAAAERSLLLVAGVWALVAFLRKAAVSAAFLCLVVGSAVTCTYSLSTRLFPADNGLDAIAGYRLSSPIGYWNSLGLYAAVGLAVAIGLVARGGRLTRAVAAAAIPIFAVTQFFTYSRGAAIALAAGLLVTFALDRQRVQWLLAGTFAGAVAAVGVLAAGRSPALTTEGLGVERAAHEGHRLALVIVGLCALSAGLAYWHSIPTFQPRVRRIVVAAVVLALAIGSVAGLAAVGGPSGIRTKFTAPPSPTHGHLNERFLSFSGSYRAPLWSQAWGEYKTHPLLGGGARSYETYYLQHRTRPDKVRNAHSLYLETLAELGPIGLAFLLIALLTPLYAAVRARRQPFVPALAGAYVALLVHMSVDWDWQVTAVALTGLFCGVGILVAARSDEDEQSEMSPRARRSLLAATLAVMVAAFVGLAGNMSLAKAATAAGKGDWVASARDARRAHTWAPWSSEPHRLLGEAELGRGDTRGAVKSFDKAIAKSSDDWNLWFDLARATTGGAQRDALRQAKVLNPLSPEIAELERELAAEKVITLVQR